MEDKNLEYTPWLFEHAYAKNIAEGQDKQNFP
jgi:hypothetical protein